MTKSQIYDECVKISNGLSQNAYEAYHLASKCLSARTKWRKDYSNTSAQYAYGEAATKLEDYCKANKSIRAEAVSALAKVNKLINVELNSKTSYKDEADELNRQIKMLEAKRKKVDTLALIMTIVMIISGFLTVASIALGFYIGDFSMIRMFTFEVLAVFVVSLIITIVRSCNRKKAIKELEKAHYVTKNIAKIHDNDRLRDAYRAKECYELIIRGVGGASLADYR